MLGTIDLGEKKSTQGLILKGDQLPRPPLFDMSVLGLARYVSQDKNDPLVTKNFQRIFCKKKYILQRHHILLNQRKIIHKHLSNLFLRLFQGCLNFFYPHTIRTQRSVCFGKSNFKSSSYFSNTCGLQSNHSNLVRPTSHCPCVKCFLSKPCVILIIYIKTSLT